MRPARRSAAPPAIADRLEFLERLPTPRLSETLFAVLVVPGVTPLSRCRPGRGEPVRRGSQYSTSCSWPPARRNERCCDSLSATSAGAAALAALASSITRSEMRTTFSCSRKGLRRLDAGRLRRHQSVARARPRADPVLGLAAGDAQHVVARLARQRSALGHPVADTRADRRCRRRPRDRDCRTAGAADVETGPTPIRRESGRTD